MITEKLSCCFFVGQAFNVKHHQPMWGIVGLVVGGVSLVFSIIGLRSPCWSTIVEDGGWSSWENWVNCSVSCGGGLRHRGRQCTNPSPSPLGRYCDGSPEQTEMCNNVACQDGGWSPWENWVNCSVSCGGGLRHRGRQCTNPSPSPLGRYCDGSPEQTEMCNNVACQVTDGGWSPWENWVNCSVSCGGGLRHRGRQCTNPSPSPIGRYCDGSPEQTQMCNNVACQDGGWSSWENWVTCSASCGGGLRHRGRQCTNPSPSPLGRYCDGSPDQSEMCNAETCNNVTYQAHPTGQTTHHVAFSANSPNGTLLNGTYGSIPIFTKMTINLGDAYNQNTGKFTCPVAGLYQFSVYIYQKGYESAHCIIRHNTHGIEYTGTASDGHDSSSISVYALLALNDIVHLDCGKWGQVHHGVQTAFIGALIEPN